MDYKLHGIDISKWQGGQIDYDEAAKNVDFVIIRAAYGTHEDAYFRRHYEEFHKRGVPCGAYQFAVWDESVEDEAEAFLRITWDCQLLAGCWYDVEWSDNVTGPSVTNEHRTRMARAWIDKVAEDRGKDYSGIYCSLAFWLGMLDRNNLDEIPLWIAAYGEKWDNDVACCAAIDPDIKIRQFSGSGKAYFSKCDIDLDGAYCDFAGVKAELDLGLDPPSEQIIKATAEADFPSEGLIDGLRELSRKYPEFKATLVYADGTPDGFREETLT